MLQIGSPSGAASAYDPSNLTAPFGYLANAIVSPLARWDSVWYLTIAHSGYAHIRERMAFFPLYPALIHVLGWIVRSRLLAGVLISLVAFAIALYLLQQLVRLDFGEEVAPTTVLLIAFCPMAFFFSAVYTESLFLALSVGSIYAARRERWALCGVLGLLAALSRNGGIALILPTAVIYLYGAREVGAHPLGAEARSGLASAAAAQPPARRCALAAADPGRAGRLPGLPRHQVRRHARSRSTSSRSGTGTRPSR